MIERLIAMLAFLGFALSGCNTMEGVGEDVQKGGEKLENAAEKAKN